MSTDTGVGRVKDCRAAVTTAEQRLRRARLHYYRAVAALHEGDDRMSYAQIGVLLGMTAGRAHQLVVAGQQADQVDGHSGRPR